MQLIDQRLAYSATDLVGFLECRHLANLERAATLVNDLKRPIRDDPVLDRMARRGQEYEARFLEDAARQRVETIAEIRPPDTVSPSRQVQVGARRNAAKPCGNGVGRDLPGRAARTDGGWGTRTSCGASKTPSDLGACGATKSWDTKLARQPSAPAVLQICMYSDLLGAIQGRMPETDAPGAGRRRTPNREPAGCGLRGLLPAGGARLRGPAGRARRNGLSHPNEAGARRALRLLPLGRRSAGRSGAGRTTWRWWPNLSSRQRRACA